MARALTTPKKDRVRLAKAELLMELALRAECWKRQATDQDSAMRPFAEWTPDDPLRAIAITYNLTGEDLGRILDRLGSELEARADRAGYADTWRDLSG